MSRTPYLMHFSCPPPLPTPLPLHPTHLSNSAVSLRHSFQFTHPLPHLTSSPGTPPLHFLIHLLYRDGFLVCLLDTVTSILWGYVFFSLQESYEDTFTNFEPDTSFVFTISSVILAHQDFLLWPILFFAMIFALGFNSQVTFSVDFTLLRDIVTSRSTYCVIVAFILHFHFVGPMLYLLPHSVSWFCR